MIFPERKFIKDLKKRRLKSRIGLGEFLEIAAIIGTLVLIDSCILRYCS